MRAYVLTSNAELRDNRPPDKKISFSEARHHPTIRTGNIMFDGLYAMAVHEALLNSVSQIRDWAYGGNSPISLEVFQTGEAWTYVWTRDLAYSVYLALAGFDPQRAETSLLFKTSVLKPAVDGGFTNQIIQDTGSGGSYPISSDRVVWALGADATLNYLPDGERGKFLREIYPILHDTIEQDRRLIFDPSDGLYRGEQSFLDWREQTYPAWTKDNVSVIGMSKALSVNAADYFLLKTAARYAALLGLTAAESRYQGWAETLKRAINREFFDRRTGLYSTYLLSDGIHEIRVQRYDCLGEALAILCGVADHDRAESILKNYPVGPYGPPVVWPEDRDVPIYHNHAIWPFVTAFWTKAAQQADNWRAVNLGVETLEREAAFNLSNMENYDFVTGRAEIKGEALNGPVVNSRRQLWSVAGYLAMVQDVVFGLETSWDGVRFRPYVTAQMRNEIFGDTGQIELRDFNYRGARITVRVYLPAASASQDGVCAIDQIKLNGKAVGRSFVPRSLLAGTNVWDVYLRAPKLTGRTPSLRVVNVRDDRQVFGPPAPVWNVGQGGGITATDGKLVLHFRDDATNILFNIYRNGKLRAAGVREASWVDNASGDYLSKAYYYSVEAVDPLTGNVSHLTPSRGGMTGVSPIVISANEMKNQGGNLVDGQHFENWGRPKDTLATENFSVKQDGRYAIRVEFSNGSGPVNTGITCGVKKLEVVDAHGGRVVASGHLIMPQSGDWKRWDISNPIIAALSAGDYLIRISEDAVSRNMSYLKNNERYTAWPGGGDSDYNFVNIMAVQLNWLSKR